jgi:hypothetical protein
MLLAAVVCGTFGLAAPAQSLPAQDSTAKRVFVLPHVLEKIDAAISQPVPSGLSPADAKSWAAETAWLKSAKSRIESVGIEYGVLAPRDRATGMATGRRQYRPAEISKSVDSLRAVLEAESRKFNTLSNASKARHDIAMNAIRNMKA